MVSLLFKNRGNVSHIYHLPQGTGDSSQRPSHRAGRSLTAGIGNFAGIRLAIATASVIRHNFSEIGGERNCCGRDGLRLDTEYFFK